MLRNWIRFSAIVTAIIASNWSFADAPYFTGLGGLGGAARSWAAGISADGTTTVGGSTNAMGVVEAYRWTAATGMVALGLPPDALDSYAAAVSADGSVIVGNSMIAGVSTGWRWTQTEGFSLVHLGPAVHLFLNDVAGDGQVAVGSDYGEGRWCRDRCSGYGCEDGWYRWWIDQRSGYHQDHPGSALHPLTGGQENTLASAISLDGSTIVGASWIQNCNEEELPQATIWRPSGVVIIGALPDGTHSYAAGASQDGSTVVGTSSGAAAVRAFRWTDAGGMQDIGSLAGYRDTYANRTSADGSIVVGTADNWPDRAAFIWDEVHGIRDFRVLLIALGLDVSGWTRFAIGGISSDGRTLAGTAVNPNGLEEPWIAHLGDGCDLPGDLNQDGVVDLADLAVLLTNFGQPDGAHLSDGDFDGDNDVDLTDLATLLANFGAACS